MDVNSQFVSHEVTKVKDDDQVGSATTTLEMEADSHELPYQMNEVESHKPRSKYLRPNHVTIVGLYNYGVEKFSSLFLGDGYSLLRIWGI